MSNALTTVTASPTGIALAVQNAIPKTNLPALDHTLKVGAVQNDRAARGLAAATATLRLAAEGLDAQTLSELLAMQKATMQRLTALQKGWVQGWMGWFAYADQLKGANTMSKLMERESNIFTQAVQLLMRQATDLATLQENVEVDYAYWVSEVLAERLKGEKKSFLL